MAVERESLHYKNNKTGLPKETVTAVDGKSNVHRVRMPNHTNTHVSSTNLLPSKFDKPPGRPLPPLEHTGSDVHRNDSRASFKPAKFSDHRGQHSVPLKGQRALTNNSSTQTTHRSLKVHTAVRQEEFVHTASADDDFDSMARNWIKSKSQLQRSHSVSRLSGLSSTSSKTALAALPDSVSVSPDMKPIRSTTPQQLAINRNASIKMNGQVSVKRVSASDNSDSVVTTQIPRRRSSSVSSLARISLHKTNPSQSSSSLTIERQNKQAAVSDLMLVEGRLNSSCAKDNLSMITTSCESSESHHAPLPSNLESMQLLCSKSSEQYTRDSQLYNVKALEKSSLNHGILGGKSDDGLKCTVDIGQRCLPAAPECCNVV